MKILNKKNGFSLIEIISVLAVMGAMSYGGLTLFKSLTTYRKKSEENNEVNLLHLSMIQNFRNDSACVNTLAPIGDLSSSKSIPEIRNFNNNVLFTKTVKYGHQTIEIESMSTAKPKLESDISGNNQRGTLEIVIRFKKISKSNKASAPTTTVSQYTTKRIPLEIVTDNAFHVISCRASVGNINNRVTGTYCNSIGGTLSSPLCIFQTYPNTPLASHKAITNEFLNDIRDNYWDTIRYLRADQDDSTRFGLKMNALVTETNLEAGAFTILSDRRLKKNIRAIDHPNDKISELAGVRYNFIGTNKTVIGLIAQNVDRVIPEVVKETSDGYLTVSYEEIIPILIEAVKNNQKKIDGLKKVKEKIIRLEKKLNRNKYE